VNEPRPPITAKELRTRAVALLARREHSRAELARKLASHGLQEDIVNVLAELENEGLLSNERAAAAYVRAHGDRFGAARLHQDLRQRGLDLAMAGTAVDDLAGELERARAIWARKFARVPADAREWARQARFLQSRGFAVDIIRRVLKTAGCLGEGDE
jgi:regulatory protein